MRNFHTNRTRFETMFAHEDISRHILSKRALSKSYWWKRRNNKTVVENKKKFMKRIYRWKITEFIKKNHNFQKHFINVLRQITSMTSNESDVKRFVKMFDSFLFSNEKIMSIFQWIIKMKNKLFVNANYFDTKKLKMIYILSRTEDFAAKHLNFCTHERFIFLFFLNENMLVILKEMFDDLNRKLTTINEFRVLRTKDKNFHIF